ALLTGEAGGRMVGDVVTKWLSQHDLTNARQVENIDTLKHVSCSAKRASFPHPARHSMENATSHAFTHHAEPVRQGQRCPRDAGRQLHVLPRRSIVKKPQGR